MAPFNFSEAADRICDVIRRERNEVELFVTETREFLLTVQPKSQTEEIRRDHIISKCNAFLNSGITGDNSEH